MTSSKCQSNNSKSVRSTNLYNLKRRYENLCKPGNKRGESGSLIKTFLYYMANRPNLFSGSSFYLSFPIVASFPSLGSGRRFCYSSVCVKIWDETRFPFLK